MALINHEIDDFNPHSPRGGATICRGSKKEKRIFQSTLPTRGSDRMRSPKRGEGENISIHAPHEGERRQAADMSRGDAYFNPRSPRGGATMLDPDWPGWDDVFQSTLPTRGSDHSGRPCRPDPRVISIHAPHEGERLRPPNRHAYAFAYFNPRSPRGGATLNTIRTN